MNEKLTRMFYQTKRYLRKEAPAILSCLGTAGVVVTTVLAIRATPKAVRLLDEADEMKKELEEELSTVEKVKIAAPVYIPTIVAGTVTIGCIVGSNLLSYKQQVSLMSAYTVMDSTYKKYRGKVKELLGTENDILVQKEIAEDRAKECELSEPANGKLLWYEPYRDEFFELTEKEVIDAEYHLKRGFILRGERNLNEFYACLGLEPTHAGSDIGWDMYSDEFYCDTTWLHSKHTWIDFEHHLVTRDEGPDYYMIEIVFPACVGLLDE